MQCNLNDTKINTVCVATGWGSTGKWHVQLFEEKESEGNDSDNYKTEVSRNAED